VSGQDLLVAVLRAAVTVASIAAAGGVFFKASFPRAAIETRGAVAAQVLLGCCLLLFLEPIRYGVFQLAAAQGDWRLAFDPSLRWMAFQTPMGQAAGTRWVAALVLLTLGRKSIRLALAASVALVLSYALEGHTASEEAFTVFGTAAVLLHVAAVHWWLGALHPLLVLTRAGDPQTTVAVIEAFSRRAVWIVAGLVAAGGLLLAMLTHWTLKLESAYQQRFLFKLALVALLLSLAAWNKMRLTPLLARNYEAGSATLAASIKMEMIAGLAILAATAWAIGVSPDD